MRYPLVGLLFAFFVHAMDFSRERVGEKRIALFSLEAGHERQHGWAIDYGRTGYGWTGIMDGLTWTDGTDTYMEFMAIAMRWVRAASLKVYICDAFSATSRCH
jgi:hypothetical protein